MIFIWFFTHFQCYIDSSKTRKLIRMIWIIHNLYVRLDSNFIRVVFKVLNPAKSPRQHELFGFCFLPGTRNVFSKAGSRKIIHWKVRDLSSFLNYHILETSFSGFKIENGIRKNDFTEAVTERYSSSMRISLCV